MDKSSTRHRSPAYPSIDLETAIERARVVWDHEHRTAAAADVIATHWGYKSNSANGMRCIAALKQYGLLDELGERGDRILKLSERALAILLDETEDSPDRARAVAEAALAPKLYGDLWSERRDASDANLRTYLIRDLAFNPGAVNPLIKQYRDTVKFAQLKNDGILSVDGEDKIDGESRDLAPHKQNDAKRLMDPTTAIPLAVLEDDGSIRMISIPRMSEKAFQFLKGMLDTYKTAIVLPKAAESKEESSD